MTHLDTLEICLKRKHKTVSEVYEKENAHTDVKKNSENNKIYNNRENVPVM